MTFLIGRTAANSLRASRAGRKTASHFSWPVLPLILLLMVVSLAACGVKNDLIKPNGEATSKSERDPSLPPSPTGR